MANSKETATEKVVEEKVKSPTPKKVKILIPMTREDESDVTVGVNGRIWQIQRGEEVEVPECVAEVLRNQNDALKRVIENERKLTK